MAIHQKKRLDRTVIDLALAPTRSRARDLILRGLVRVSGCVVTRPGELVAAGADVTVDPAAEPYVSRAGVKLAAALEAFGFSPEGRVALDIGASTGGFTDVLLRGGAARVFAVDVGRGQLDPGLAADPRVVSLEGVNARDLGADAIGEPVTAIVADVSFIGLTLVLPPALALAAGGAWLAALVKPQFEAGREAVGKGGIVRDADVRAAAVGKVRGWLEARPGWRVVGVVESPLPGRDGNLEYLIGGRLGA